MADNDDDSRELPVAIVALIISLIALVATILQVLQTYFGTSAAGFARCGPRVMGEWGKYTKRTFKLFDLRFEVEFETPVIFLAAPENINGPVLDGPIWYMDGSPESYRDTRILPPKDDAVRVSRLSRKERIHTADNERASWVELLAVVQKMEHDSGEWQRRFYNDDPGRDQPTSFGDRTLAVAVQKKTKSWDTMPSGMTKPYATTTICHIVELAAVLGLHWKEFSRSSDKYRAEGNGYMLTGAHVNDLGLVFAFQRIGQNSFEENRVIPTSAVKRLCFGVVPTIFCSPQDDERLKYPFDQPEDLAALQLGSPREIADTLRVMGCNTNTINYFLQDHKTMIHLFPVAFEMLGMLGRTLHGYASGFRMLPNPTIYLWDRKSFSMWKLLLAYKEKLAESDELPENDHIWKIKKDLESIFKAKSAAKFDLAIPVLDTIHRSLDGADEFLQKIEDHHIYGILRGHFQAVLGQLNKPDGTDGHFDLLNMSAPEDKQRDFIDIYVDLIRPEAVSSAPKRKFTTNPNGRTAPTPPSDDDESMKRHNVLRSETGFKGDDLLNTVWYTLVFRMLCWLLLHDFHKQDVQISKSELLGSRLPVYIA